MVCPLVLSQSKDIRSLIRSALIFPIILSLPKDIRSLFVSALERIAEAKGIASIQSARAGVEARAIASSPGASPGIFPGLTRNAGIFKSGCPGLGASNRSSQRRRRPQR